MWWPACTTKYHFWSDIGECVLAFSLLWRHNEHDSVSNHQPRGCLLDRLFRRRSKKTSKLRVTGLCVGNSPGPVNSPHKGPVTRKMFPFDDVIMLLDGAKNDNDLGYLAQQKSGKVSVQSVLILLKHRLKWSQIFHAFWAAISTRWQLYWRLMIQISVYNHVTLELAKSTMIRRLMTKVCNEAHKYIRNSTE